MSVTRTVLVNTNTLEVLADVLTSYGRIVGIDHEGTITYEIEGEDEFELGRLAASIEGELSAYETHARITSGKDKRR
jgi:hypothetical protein